MTFEISRSLNIHLEIVDGSKIYTIDNFYENSQSVLDYFLNNKPALWKSDDLKSNNGKHFDDRRHSIISEEITPVYNFLSFLCDRKSINPNHICTNVTKFQKGDFNNYQNNYWWPHLDPGYTAIIYFNNHDEVSGTNLYKCLEDNYKPTFEHWEPWISKDKFSLIKTLSPKFNRLVLFDAAKFYHGMNICNDNYFEDSYRLNQVLFFE